MLSKHDLDQIRGLMQDELAPIKTDIDTVRQDILVVNHKVSGLELGMFRLEKRTMSIERNLIHMINAFGEEFGRVDKRLNTIEGSLRIRAN